ncbi:hypothetical protein [Streptomyces milbemycinicus]|uniref:Uncharacterized protein n=1 Tax=Streptomyces milbemycinicus TaxID=476552 RepID=A0ABW8M321_9ACTN
MRSIRGSGLDEVRPRVTACGLPWLAKTPATNAGEAANWLFTEHRNPWLLGPSTDWSVGLAILEETRRSHGLLALRRFLDDLIALCAVADALATLYLW